MLKACLFAAALAAPAAAFADDAPPPGKTSDVKPIAKEDQDKLNEVVGQPQDAKIKIAPIGQSDKDNLNRAVNWLDEKIGPLGPPKKRAAQAATAATPTTAPAARE